MDWQAWYALVVIAGIVGILAFTKYAIDVVMIGGVVILTIPGAIHSDWTVVSIKDAMAGMSNEGMITVAVLFIVAAGVRETGGMQIVASRLLGKPKDTFGAQVRMMFPVAGLSAFMNNTPLVAMMVPVVSDWSKKYKIPVSKLMMPLSFATILGGLCSLIGTSTNVITSGLWRDYNQGDGLGMFEVSWVGIPAALLGIGYMLVFSRWLLPNRVPPVSVNTDVRQYSVEMLIDPAGPMVGKTVEQAGLRHLHGSFLVEIERSGEVIAAVGPDQKLQANDRLVFAGVVDAMIELQKLRGLIPATNQVFKLDSPREQRCLVEAVVSKTNPLVGKTIRDGKFRSVYQAAVLAVGRFGERINKKIGDIELQPGDTLLLEAHPSFVGRMRNSKDFYLVSALEGSGMIRHNKAWISISVLLAMVVVASFEWLPMVACAMLAAGAMILTRCVTARDARRTVDWQLLLTIAASFALGRAIESTGAAKAIADFMISTFAGTNPYLALAVIYVMCMVFTEIITNNSAAVLIFPIAMATAKSLGVSEMPFLMAIMMAASCGFASPLGYQTHLMVQGPGGYRFLDFTRFGLPLNLVVMTVTLVVAPWVYPF